MSVARADPEWAVGFEDECWWRIERARSAVSLLERGIPISDTAFELGYFDQAHLTNSLKRFIGRTPAQIARKSRERPLLKGHDEPAVVALAWSRTSRSSLVRGFVDATRSAIEKIAADRRKVR
jgi:hypothetical protein